MEQNENMKIALSSVVNSLCKLYDATAVISGNVSKQSATSVIDVSGNAVDVNTTTTSGGVKTTTVELKLANSTLSQTAAGLKSELHLVAVTSGLSDNISKKYELQDANGNACGAAIEIEKDKYLKSAQFVDGAGAGDDKLELTFVTNTGVDNVVDIPLSGICNEYNAASGIVLKTTDTGYTFVGVRDAESESYFTLSDAGFKVAGITDAITNAVSGEAVLRAADVDVVSGAVDDEVTRATGIEDGLRSDVDTVSGYVNTLKADDTTDGSVAKTVKTAVDALSGAIGAGFDSTSTVVAKITNDVADALSTSKSYTDTQIAAYDAALSGLLTSLETIENKINTLV